MRISFSNEFDIYPDFEWFTVIDPDTPGSAEGITYDVKVIASDEQGSFTVVLDTVSDIPGASAISAPVFYSWMSGLGEGSYMVQVRANDGEYLSDWSEGAIFRIRPENIDISKVIIVAPPYVDPRAGQPRFWTKDMIFQYQKASKDPTRILIG